MIRHSKLPKDILDRIQDAANYLESRNDVWFAYLFGGLSTGEPKPLSDVDIAVYLSEDMKCDQAKSEIVEKLADILLTDEIDVIILNRSSLPLSMNVIKRNRLLVDKRPFLRHAYQSLMMRKYFDYHHLESNILKRRFYPKDAKSGGHQSQGVKGEAVIGYRDSLTTQDMKPSSFRGR